MLIRSLANKCVFESEGSGAPPPMDGAESEPGVSQTEPEAGGSANGDPAPNGVEPSAEPEAPKPARAEDWRDARIRKLTAKFDEIRRRAEELERAAAAKPGEAVAPDVEALVERRASEKAARIAAEQAFNAACEEVNVKGTAAFKDWQKKITALAGLVDQKDIASVRAYSTLVATAIETGSAPEILHALGSDLNEAERVMGLPPVKQAIELARLAAKAGPAVSAAPRPITPIGSRGANHDNINPADPEKAGQLTTAEWMRRREAQIAEMRKRA